MMEGDRHYELRSRSRSRSETPQLNLRESSEHQYDLRRSSRERSNTPAELPTGSRSSRSMAQGNKKVADKNMDTIVEQREETPKSNISEVTVKSTVKKVERRSERQKVKKQMFVNGQNESDTSKLTTADTLGISKNATSDYSTDDTDKENGPSKPKTAYEIYKQAGEWWNVFPKTDYTYSESSQCRYEIAPGILAMPNMSRRSIHSNEKSSFASSYLSTTSQSINTSATSKEISQNWLNSTLSPQNDIVSINGILQVVPHIRDTHGTNTMSSQFNSFYYNSSLRQRSFDSNSHIYTNIKDLRSQESTRWYQRIIYTIMSYFSIITRILERVCKFTSDNLYLLLASILLLDTWLLSKLSKLRDGIVKRRTKFLYFLLLSLALWGGLNYNQLMSGKNSVQIDQTFSSTNDSRIELLLNRIRMLEDKNAQQSEKLQELLLKLNKVYVTPDELNQVHVEIQYLKELYEQIIIQNKERESPLPAEEIELRMRQILHDYMLREEWSKILSTLVTRDEFIQIINEKETKPDCTECLKSTTTSTVDSSDIIALVKQLLKIYDADKTGRVDFALESAGGQIISTRCTQNYNLNTRAFKVMGWTMFYESNNPRTVIQGHPMQPGLCWAFQDFPGYLLIKTRSLIYVTGFTLEHVPKSILPNGDMGSAPRKFNVWGLKDENDSNPVMFGEYTFENSEENLQYFPVQNTSITEPYHFVELRIHSNHGRLEYTCLYRFRIHGNLA